MEQQFSEAVKSNDWQFHMSKDRYDTYLAPLLALRMAWDETAEVS